MVNLKWKTSKIEVSKANIGVSIMLMESNSLVNFEECSALIYMCKDLNNLSSGKKSWDSLKECNFIHISRSRPYT